MCLRRCAAPLNTPDQGLYSSPPLPAIHDVYDTSGGSFLTGGGNIYSPSLPIDIDVVTPNYNLGPSGWTTVVLQTVTLGTTLDLASVRVTSGGTTRYPIDAALLFTQPLGGFGGVQEDRWFEFHLPGNAESYTFELLASGGSLSFDRVAVDTIWVPGDAPIDEPNPVPEPSSLVLTGAALFIFGMFVLRRKAVMQWCRCAGGES
jgi:hypothetical protein